MERREVTVYCKNLHLLAGESNPALPRSGDGGFRHWQAGVSELVTAILTDILARIWWWRWRKHVITITMLQFISPFHFSKTQTGTWNELPALIREEYWEQWEYLAVAITSSQYGTIAPRSNAQKCTASVTRLSIELITSVERWMGSLISSNVSIILWHLIIRCNYFVTRFDLRFSFWNYRFQFQRTNAL